MLPDYYSILKVSSNATPEKIRAAYRRLAKQRHPDAGGTAAEFRALREAYAILSEPESRRKCDAQRAPAARRSVRRASPGRSRARFVEPLIPSQPPDPLLARRPSRASETASLRGGNPLAEFDRLFREFDDFFDHLEEQFHKSYWGRSE
jgi:curved DNA-binding protein CbpA